MKTMLFLSLFTVSAAFGAVEVEHATFGFNGGYKTGTWAPLTITVRGQDEPLTSIGGSNPRINHTHLVVEVRTFSSDAPIQRYATPLTGSKRKNFYVYCPKNVTQLVIQLAPEPQSGNTALQSTVQRVMQEILLPTPVARKDYLVLVLAPGGDKLKRFIDKRRLEVSDDAQVHVKYLPNSTSLLRDWIGYSAIDVLVIRETFLTERHISKAQQTALLDWVQRGGTLIMSGGSSFNYLQGSFIEPFLPVQLKGMKKTNTLPTTLHEQLDTAIVQSFGETTKIFEYIEFTPNAGCKTLIGTTEHIYVAKRDFGNGQILCFAFDYNAPPFSNPEVGEAFWHRLLSKSGKSPRHLADQYALSRRHEEKIHKQFLSKMPTQVPLIKLLTIVLPAYLLAFGGFLLYFGRFKQKLSIYWIGSCLFILLSVSAIAVTRNILPNSIAADRFSILSVYPERQRAHLQSFVSIRTTARTKTSIEFPEGTFIRHQETELSQKIGTLIQGSHVQLQDVFVEPWHPTTYVQEAWTQQLPVGLENAWRITDKKITYLGNVTLRYGELPDSKQASKFSTAQLPLRATSKIPPDEELNDTRKIFARILQQEGVLQYLAMETDLSQRPYIIGWTSQGFADIVTDRNFSTNDETLVIFRASTGR